MASYARARWAPTPNPNPNPNPTSNPTPQPNPAPDPDPDPNQVREFAARLERLVALLSDAPCWRLVSSSLLFAFDPSGGAATSPVPHPHPNLTLTLP